MVANRAGLGTPKLPKENGKKGWVGWVRGDDQGRLGDPPRPVVLVPSDFSVARREQSRLVGAGPLGFVSTARFLPSDH